MLILAWFAASAGWRELALPDEGRYVGVAWEMMRSGDWATPTLNGLPYFHKPPLFYWLTATSMSLFGVSEWSARLASLLAATGGTVALWAFLRRWTSAVHARAALVACLAYPLWYGGAQYANLDMLVAGCITASILLFAHTVHSLESGGAWRLALAGAWTGAALGVLAKGLIGAVLPALALIAWLLATGRTRMIARLMWWPGFVLFALIAGPWFVAMQWRHDGFLDYFFRVQHLQRFAAGGFNNVQGLWFFPALLLLASLPWLVFARWTLRVPRVRKAGAPRRSREHDIVVLMLCWLAAVVGFFSIPQSKLIGYVLPAVPPLASLLASAFIATLQRRKNEGPPGPPAGSSRRLVRPTVLWHTSAALAIVLTLGTIIFIALEPRKSTRRLAEALVAHAHDQGRPVAPVFMLGRYAFDFPLHARLRDPVTIVDAWGDPTIELHDNWRRELADAARFAPPTSAATLVPSGALPAALCAVGRAWLIGAPDAVRQWPMLAHARALPATPDTTVAWEVDSATPAIATALECPGRAAPNQGFGKPVPFTGAMR